MTLEFTGSVLPTKAEIVNDAIMSGQAAIVVEGITDIQLYRGIVNCLEREAILRPVELIDGFSEGCHEVVRLIEDLEKSADLGPYIKGNIVGVIDKDVRDFRNEVPESESLFVLKLYSIESHYVCETVLARCIVEATHAPQDDRLNQISREIYQSFAQNHELFYLASVEALRAALEPGYSAEYRYSDTYGRLNDTRLRERLQLRKIPICEYAHTMGLNCDINIIRKISKGKTLLDFYCSTINNEIRKLKSACRAGNVPRCDYCDSGIAGKCYYKVKTGVSDASLRNTILGQFPTSELSYIIDGLTEMLQPETT
jgi:hypothetical protein